MRTTWLFLLIVTAFAVAFPETTITQSERRDFDDAIQRSTAYPFYWEYKGEPVLLIGGSDNDNLYQWTGERLTEHLDLLAGVGGNYVRNTMSDRDDDNVFAFAEVGDGVYNLEQWNEEYWDRLEFFLQETSERDIIVQLTFWDHFDFNENHPWHPESNINYGPDAVVDEDDFFGGSVLQENEEILGYQRRFVDKILSISLQYGNVLYNINNEGSEPRAWDNYWAAYIKERAAEQGRRIYVTSMMLAPGSSVRSAMTYPELYDYADISQNNQDSQGGRGPAHYTNVLNWREKVAADPMPLNNVKNYGSDAEISNFVSGAAGTEREAIARLWKNIFAGAASARFHRPDAGWGIGLNEKAQTNLRALSMLLDEFDIFEASPQPTLLKSYADLPAPSMEAYCLADIGNAYTVYFPEGRFSIDLDPWVYADRVRVRWLHIDDGTWSEPEIVTLDWEGSLDDWGYRGAVRLTTPRPGSAGPPGHGSAIALVEVLDIRDDL